MVMNLDKCIGCHTCSILCKNVWTNRRGAEYMYFNNVETKPGIGYPKQWENQEKWKGGWELKDGELSLKTGGKISRLAKLFYHPQQPEMDDYYEPWTYDYETLIHTKRRNHQPVARPRSLITQKRMEIKWGPNWEDDLADGQSARKDYNLGKIGQEITLEFHDIFMKHLPRLCNHCLNPACVAACPSGAIYKRDEDGVVLISQDGCRGWRHCVPACPYKKIYYNWETNKAEKCVFCFPRLENGLPTVCSDGCVGRMRYLGVLFYDADKVKAAASTPDPKDIYKAYLDALCDPNDLATVKAAHEAGIPDRWIRAAQNSPSYRLIAEWQLAFPLHPEYRTLPNIWYVPPLSPIARRAEEKVFFPGAAEMRIPVAYLAQLLTAFSACCSSCAPTCAQSRRASCCPRGSRTMRRPTRRCTACSASPSAVIGSTSPQACRKYRRINCANCRGRQAMPVPGGADDGDKQHSKGAAPHLLSL